MTELYCDKVENLLKSLQSGESFVISDKVKPENKEHFIALVKFVIDKNIVNVIFSNDYERVIKQ